MSSAEDRADAMHWEGRRPERSAVADLASHLHETALPSVDDVDPRRPLPDGTALLVVAEQVNGLKLTFYYEGTISITPEESAASLRNGLKSIYEFTQKAKFLSESGQEHMPWRDAYGQVSGMWRDKQVLMAWIRRLLTAEGPRRLIIKDNTGLGIPWELYFYHPVPNDPLDVSEGGWLGALIPITRWVNLLNSSVARRETADQCDCVAGMIVLEAGDLSALPAEYDLFLVEPRTDDMNKFLGWLRDGPGTFGMVMIRCHGTHAADPNDHKLNKITYNAYDHFDYAALARNQALVLLNSCFGAMPGGGPSDLPITFSELFLRKGASGVIAATADIDQDHSQELAGDLLAAASEDHPIKIADWLLGWRRDYAEAAEHTFKKVFQSNVDNPFADQVTLADYDKAFKRFFEAFKFVYFGHVDSTLRAVPTSPNGQVV